MKFIRFFTLEEAMEQARIVHDPDVDTRADAYWRGDKTMSQTIEDILAGRGVVDAGEYAPYLRVFDTYAREDTPQPAYGIAGFYPDVPAYLAGRPDNMRWLEPLPERLTPTTSAEPFNPRALVLMSSIPYSADPFHIVRRAMVIASYAMRLSESHPVELWVANAVRQTEPPHADIGWAVRMDPRRAGQVVALCDTAGVRTVGFNLLALAGGAPGRGEGYLIECDGYGTQRTTRHYAHAVCRAFGFPFGSLVITGAFDTVDPEGIIQSATVYEPSGIHVTAAQGAHGP